MKMRLKRRIAVKRVLDTAAIIVASPLVLLVSAATALAVQVKLGSPVLFKQERIGLNEKPFTLLKFRSMLPEKDSDGNVLSPAERLTPFGKLLRKSSMDELPQLWNVLRGDMSLVGPRPLFPEYLTYYRDSERPRHWVRPGITGAAQVGGRNAATWNERLERDAMYAEKGTLLTDVGIVFDTLCQVLTARGTQADPSQHGEYLSVHRSYPEKDGVALRRFEPSDIPTRVEWFGDDRITETMRIDKNLTEEGTRSWLTKARANPLRKDLTAYDVVSGKTLAFVGYKAETEGDLPEFYLAVSPERHGEGIGRKVMELLFDFMENSVKTAGAVAEMFVDNAAAVRLYQSLGMRIVSRTEDAERVRMEIRW